MNLKTSIAVIAALLLSACGGGGGEGDGGAAPPAPAADVSIIAVGPAGLVPSESSTHIDLTVNNAGPGTATNLVIRPNLSDQLNRGGTITCAASGGAVCPPVTAENFEVPTLPPGGSMNFRIETTLGPRVSGRISSSSNVSAVNDGTPGNNAAVSIIEAYWADLSVTGSALGTTVAAGDTARYTMTVSNAGPDAARNVAIGNWPDAGQLLETMSCSASGGAVCPVTPGPRMTVPVLPAAGSLQFTLAASVPAGTSGSIGNGMFAVSAGDPDLFGNYAAAGTLALFTAPVTGNVIEFRSDAGDYIGQGATYSYTRYNAALSVSAVGGHISVEVNGDQRWFANFVLPAAFTQVQPGTYANLARYPFNDAAAGGISWYGESRGCNSIQGSFVIDSATYANGELTALSLSFEQHCEGATEALRGQIRWSANDTTTPPGPHNPPPTLWSPTSGTTPATGSYVYLESDPYEYVARGATHVYTPAIADLSVTVSGGNVKVQVRGNEDWNGEFQAMSSVSQLQPGYYGGLRRHPFHNPARGGIDWWGEGRGCNREGGWFIVDAVTHVNDVLSTLDLRFEKHCENGVPALRGKIHWDANDTTTPPGPVNPPPGGLWTPAAGATPATGNYIHLVSDPGDYIGEGRTLTYTPADATLTLQTYGNRLMVFVTDSAFFLGDFQAMSSVPQLQPGYYGNVQRAPFHNPTVGGLSWSGLRACDTVTGWFVIDNVSYTNGVITAIDLRFEQHCDGKGPALRGKIHWGP